MKLELERQTRPCVSTRNLAQTGFCLVLRCTARTSGHVLWERQAFLASPNQELSSLGENNCLLAAVPPALLSWTWGGGDLTREILVDYSDKARDYNLIVKQGRENLANVYQKTL